MKGIYCRRCWLDNKLQEAAIYYHDGVIVQIQKKKPDNFDNIEDVGSF
jgi:hypothetical protein